MSSGANQGWSILSVRSDARKLSLGSGTFEFAISLIFLQIQIKEIKKLKQSESDTVSDVVESKVHQCQQNSDA